MTLKRLIDGLYMLSGTVNMYLLDSPEGFILFDAGFPGDEQKVPIRRERRFFYLIDGPQLLPLWMGPCF